jgi:hypothetical protein
MSTPSIQPAVQASQPSLPDLSILTVPAGQVLLFKARGRGVQIYTCDPATHAFGPATPQAILVTDEGYIIHHFKGPTWQAADGSLVVGTVVHKAPAPADDAIPWLLLSAAPGGTAGGLLSKVGVQVTVNHSAPLIWGSAKQTSAVSRAMKRSPALQHYNTTS